jgi:unsaturated chondroitin disaccharide hydrolase
MIMINFQKMQPKLENAFEYAQYQVWTLTENYPDFFPMYTVEGHWKHSGESWTHWCDGFLGGMMWLFYKRSGQPRWFDKARHYSQLISHRNTDTQVHDLGFLFWSTYHRWYELTGEEDLNQVTITAGKTMGLRYQEKGGYLCSFIGKHSLFIDIMMNIGIVFYAAMQSGDGELLHKAHQHCLTTRRYLVRGDGSTAHEGIFDLNSGAFLYQSTHQGWRGDSAWARGLAWAMYGFGTAFSLTGERQYLSTAQQCADFYLQHTNFQPDAIFGAGIPPNDYDDPRMPKHCESSAAAIAASGFINLANLVQDAHHANVYLDAAFTILDTLSGTRYLSKGVKNWEGILLHGIYHLEKNLGVDESVMWGDYFFVEALDKALQHLSLASSSSFNNGDSVGI